MKKIKFSSLLVKASFLALIAGGFTSCEDEYKDLPGVGDIEDLTLPESVLAAELSTLSVNNSEETILIYEITSAAASASHFRWVLPEGASIYVEPFSSDYEVDSADYLSELETYVAELDAAQDFYDSEALLDLNAGIEADSYDESILVLFDEEGEFDVEFTAFDDNGVLSTATHTITVIAGTPTPFIDGADFENGTHIVNSDRADARDPWQDSTWLDSSIDLGGIIQITSSPVYSNAAAAKFPSDGSRAAYQEIGVTPGVQYRVTFYYTIKDDVADGAVIFKVLTPILADASELDTNVIEEVTVTDQTDPSSYVAVSVEFNSGLNDTVALYFGNENAEARVDAVSIQVLE